MSAALRRHRYLPLKPAQLDMVLGDQGTYFTTDGNQVIDVNEGRESGMPAAGGPGF